MNPIAFPLHQLRQALISLTIALAIAPTMLGSQPATAQLTPAVTGFTYSFTSGRGGSQRTGIGAFSRDRVPNEPVITEPGNTDFILRPDGSFAFRIIDPTRKFGSSVQFSSTERSLSRDSNFGITQFNDFGYSVFQQ